ncbi:MAG: DUF1570 domain-containing protein [Arenimonas sp.]
MSIKLKISLLALALVAAYFGREYWLENYRRATKQSTNTSNAELQRFLDFGTKIESEHYDISSTATAEQTVLIATKAESLYKAYSIFFRDSIPINTNQPKLKLMLYKDRNEFSAFNRSSPWAEAYYLYPICYAYYSNGEKNPYHWMIHEATHQLNKEVAHFNTSKWINEGLATYFGTSKIENGELLPGNIDGNTYPIWWLSSLDLSGKLQDDIDKGKIIPLRAIISGKNAPDINKNVNLYYIEYWSFSHFLFHYENGRYARGYQKLIAEGGTLENFEKIVGPIDQVENEWYGYLQNKILETDSDSETEDRGVVEVSI